MNTISAAWFYVGISMPLLAALVTIAVGRAHARRIPGVQGMNLLYAGVGQLAASAAGIVGALVAHVLNQGQQPPIRVMIYSYAYSAAGLTFLIAVVAARRESPALSDIARGGAVLTIAAAVAVILATAVGGVPFLERGSSGRGWP
ncbi:MAG: hypothetical protein ACUVTZ_08195 [Armatimonadota bacterium]